MNQKKPRLGYQVRGEVEHNEEKKSNFPTGLTAWYPGP